MFPKVFDALSFLILLLDFTDKAKKNLPLNKSFVCGLVIQISC